MGTHSPCRGVFAHVQRGPSTTAKGVRLHPRWLMWGSEIVEGRMCWGWQAPGLLLHPVPSSHVAAVMCSLKGLAHNQKLHKLPPKPVGCHSSPPSSVQLVFIALAFDLLHLEAFRFK